MFKPRTGKSYTQRFCGYRCAMLARTAGATGCIDKHGYRRISLGSRKAGQREEHRVVMERILGRRLTSYETVHHKNGVRTDNRPENLELWASRHGRGQRVIDLPNNEASFALSFGC
jgi:hypothetical protein